MRKTAHLFRKILLFFTILHTLLKKYYTLNPIFLQY